MEFVICSLRWKHFNPTHVGEQQVRYRKKPSFVQLVKSVASGLLAPEVGAKLTNDYMHSIVRLRIGIEHVSQLNGLP